MTTEGAGMTSAEVRPVVVVGDANPDLVIRGDVVPRFGQAEVLADSADLTVGGSAAIVAMGLARLGVPTSLISRVGTDVFGRLVRDGLQERGIDLRHLGVDPDVPTGLSIILSRPQDRAILTVPGTISLLTPAKVERVLDELPGEGHLHVASFFLQPALALGLPEILARARSRGWTTSLDTNWDPTQRWKGVGAALGEVDVLLPNRDELRAIGTALGGPAAQGDSGVAAWIATLGPKVVVKNGAEGAWSVGPDGETVHVPAFDVEVVDTTGAGDSFDAGYLAACAHGVRDERTRLRWAVGAGSLSTRGPGGGDRQATAEELLRLVTR